MKTDRELLELAAKAVGIKLEQYSEMHDVFSITDDGAPWWWNALNNDGDALRIAVQLCIEVSPCDGVILVNFPIGHNRELQEIIVEIDDDRYAATRRAIVRAAASIGETL